MKTNWIVPGLLLILAACLPSDLAGQAAGSVSGFEVLRPGDILKLSVWREPSMAGEYLVDERGMVSLPLLGEFMVAGIQREVVRERVRRTLAGTIQDLSMQLTFLRRVAVVGSVRNPGLYPADASMTVGDLVGLAGGSLFAQEKWRVKWLRDGQVMDNDLSPARRLALIDLQPCDQLLVPERNWFSRNAATVIGSATSIAVALLIYSR